MVLCNQTYREMLGPQLAQFAVPGITFEQLMRKSIELGLDSSGGQNRDAWIKDADGKRVVDFAASNLHVVNYSIPVPAQRMTRDALEPHLHSLEDRPDVVPYRTTYYRHTFVVSTLADLATLRAELVRDDGAVVEVHQTSSVHPPWPCG